MKITSKPLALVVIVFFLGGIFFADLFGWWQTESSKVPITYAEGAAAGEYNPADIRGSYALGEVSELFGVPLEDLAVAFRIPANEAAAFQLKTLEVIYGESPYEIGTASMRLFVAWYKGLPYEISEETYLPVEAGLILQARGNLSAEQSAYLNNHLVLPDGSLAGIAVSPPAETTVAEPQPDAETPSSTSAPQEGEHVAPDRTVTGQTRFQDLLDWGLSLETIERVCGFPVPKNLNILIKDAVTANGSTFSTVKTALQAEIK